LSLEWEMRTNLCPGGFSGLDAPLEIELRLSDLMGVS
jgi:hypothetical protein